MIQGSIFNSISKLWNPTVVTRATLRRMAKEIRLKSIYKMAYKFLWDLQI